MEDHEVCNNVCMTVVICVALIGLFAFGINGCRGYENRVRSYIEHGYVQKQCTGDRGVIWTKENK